MESDLDNEYVYAEHPSFHINFDLHKNIHPQYRMPTIEECDELLEELDDSFELDESLLGDRMKKKLLKSKSKLKFNFDDTDYTSDEDNNSTHSKDGSHETISLGGSFDSGSDIGLGKSKDNMSFINLSKISENDSQYQELLRERKKSCLLIKHNSKPKQYWDNFLAILIIYVIIVLPYKFSFVEDPSVAWEIFDYCVDGLFLIDIILTFFHSYLDQDEQPVYSLKKIAKRYIKFWFWLDTLSILPLELFIANGDLTILLRVSRLNKIYKLVRISKMMKTSRTLRR